MHVRACSFERLLLAAASAQLLACSDPHTGSQRDADSAPVVDAVLDAGGASVQRCGVVVPVGDQPNAAPIQKPATVTVLRASDGVALDPPLATMSSPVDGRWCLDLPVEQGPFALHFQPTTEGFADTIVLGVSARAPDDPLSRIYVPAVLNASAKLAVYEPRPDAAALFGGVYRVRANQRVAVVACATVHIDEEPHPAQRFAQRYVAVGGLAVPFSELGQTEDTRGGFHFGNLTKGKHTLKVSLDGGKTFVRETSFYVGLSREDVEAPGEGLVYQLGIDLDDTKTPPDCQAADTLEKRFDPACGGGDKHGTTSQLDAAQIGDLVAYLESL